MQHCLRTILSILGIGILLVTSFTSCKKELEIVAEPFLPRYDYEAYLHKLDQSGILQTALGTEWISTGELALSSPLRITSPFAEDFYVSDREASGIGYRISAQRGQRVDITLRKEVPDSTKIFLDVFRIDNDSLGLYTHIASVDQGSLSASFEPLEDGDYIVRFQTELLRGGRFRIHIVATPSLAFPVSGKDKSAIGSLFGAPRDAGRRKHHGIDIFARRHTPIIAPCDGYIRSTKDNERGGKVVWLRDQQRGNTLYFAHLQDVLVEEDMLVQQGDTIGTVGNSGNARTTPPHLHFGIYNSGPVDPYHFVVETRTKLKREVADKSLIGKMARTSTSAKLKTEGLIRKSKLEALPKEQIAEILGASAGYYRVKLPNNTTGYVLYSELETMDRSVSSISNPTVANLYDQPSDDGIPMRDISDASPLVIYGRHQDYYYAMQGNQGKGWVRL